MTIFTHQCAECGCTVLLAPGTCDECLRHMGLHPTQAPDPTDKVVWTKGKPADAMGSGYDSGAAISHKPRVFVPLRYRKA